MTDLSSCPGSPCPGCVEGSAAWLAVDLYNREVSLFDVQAAENLTPAAQRGKAKPD